MARPYCRRHLLHVPFSLSPTPINPHSPLPPLILRMVHSPSAHKPLATSSGNDTEILLQALGKCCSSNSHLWTITDSCDEKGQRKITGVLSAIKGPWAVIYWQTVHDFTHGGYHLHTSRMRL
ncbi:hypothetical protein I3842_04G122200 [Carya illinoinensis]|uniref:Uncharacterized protein n=1 Tax=Carya illinoinensis TaxID=32201 RepID=A0A922JUS7_CARIL|nr:hypothetical protein I3842_04G122200 [Carya illinoinensis]